MHVVNPFIEFHLASETSLARRQLNTLSDEQLADIGMTRGQIRDVASALCARMAPPLKRRLATRGGSLMPLLRAFVSG